MIQTVFGLARFELGRHREGRREGVELLRELHRLLKNPPLHKTPPPPLLKKQPTSYSPY